MKFDMINDLGIARGLSPAAATTDNTARVSEILDVQGKHAVGYIILIGANTDTNATFATLVEHGDLANLGDATAVDDADLVLTEVSASFEADDDDNEVRKIGYRGNKRYVRVTVTPTGNDSGNVFLAGVWVFHSEISPVAQAVAD